MARRHSIREDSHSVVQYLCDSNIQVGTRVFFKTDLPIRIGEEYDVQWGRLKEVDRAVVLHTGTEAEMRAKKKDLEDATPPSSPPSPRSPTPPPSPKPNRRKVNKSPVKTGKPRATILAVGLPPAEHENPTAPVTPSETVSNNNNSPVQGALEPQASTPTISERSNPIESASGLSAASLPKTLSEPRTPSVPLSEPRAPVTSTPVRADVRFRQFRNTTGDDDLLFRD